MAYFGGYAHRFIEFLRSPLDGNGPWAWWAYVDQDLHKYKLESVESVFDVDLSIDLSTELSIDLSIDWRLEYTVTGGDV